MIFWDHTSSLRFNHVAVSGWISVPMNVGRFLIQANHRFPEIPNQPDSALDELVWENWHRNNPTSGLSFHR